MGQRYLAYRIAKSKGFRPDEVDSPERLRELLPREIALQHSELSEVLEADRRGNPLSIKIPGFSCIEEEYADVVIRVLETCFIRKFDLSGAIKAKMLYNASRPMKHGGKAY